MNKVLVSIVIPVYNEADVLEELLRFLKETILQRQDVEVIFSDGGSNDGTLAMLSVKALFKVISSPKGRAVQMNAGAKKASGEFLYFLHADTIPPVNFIDQILESKAEVGCFRLKFGNTKSPWLKFASWFTRFYGRLFRGGDQSLFVTKELFNRVGGFDERYYVYEDVEFILRVQEHSRFVILKDHVVTSSRRFTENGILRLYWYFGIIHFKFWKGESPDSVTEYYHRRIK
ncbi:MAG: TIGR04283 family arsenosugar biosynthesis glycosyltransferase [Bacteroidota bacterium]